MSAISNLADLIEELDNEYPRIRLFRIDGVYSWSVISTDNNQSLGVISVKIMSDGRCAKVTAFDHNSIVEYPNIVIHVDVPNLSDIQEQDKIRTLLERLRDKVMI